MTRGHRQEMKEKEDAINNTNIEERKRQSKNDQWKTQMRLPTGGGSSNKSYKKSWEKVFRNSTFPEKVSLHFLISSLSQSHDDIWFIPFRISYFPISCIH